MKNRHLLLSIIAAGALLTACNSRPTVESTPVEIARLDRMVYNFPRMDSAARVAMIDSMRPGLEAMSVVFKTPLANDTALTSFSGKTAVRMFTPEVERRFSDLDSLQSAIGGVYALMAREIPSVKPPRLYGIVAPYNNSMFMVDTVMLISLNHYLGADFEGYSYFPPFERVLKRSDMLPYDLTEAIVAINYPYQPAAGATALSRMLYEGALTHAKMQLVPEATEENALGYDSPQLRWLDDNEGRIWNELITRQLLYSTDPRDADRLVMPSPATTLINQQAPGRAGRYVGYQIVKSYLKKHPETTMEQLLNSKFYNSQTTLQESGYAPK